MVRQLLLPLLGLALLTTEAATAQKLPTKPTTAAPQKDPRTGRLLTARERRAAEKAAKAEATQASTVLAMATPTPTSSWSGWSDESTPTLADPVTRRPNLNVSVAPGMPINQVGHGVTTDYNGRPLQRAASNTTLPTQR
jgi:hypothetical protein